MSASVQFCSAVPRRAHALAAALVLLSSAAACRAAVPDLTTLPLEQLLDLEVYSASRFMQKASAAPASVTVITAADLRAFGWRTLADVLRSVRGVSVNNDRNYSYLGERGFLRPGDYNTRFLLQVDGHRINDGVYDQAPMGGEFPLELDLIERIEFVPGPGSSVYGANAFFGVINVITRKDLTGTHATLEAGQFGQRKASASTAFNDSGTALLLAASRSLTRGQDQYYAEFDTPEQNHGVAHGLDYEDGSRVYARAVHGPWTLALLHAQRTKGVPTASFEQPFNDPNSATVDTQSYAALDYRAELSPQTSLSASLAWGDYRSVGTYVNDGDPRTLNRDGSHSGWWSAGLTLVSAIAASHKLLLGAELQRDYRLDQFSYDVAPYASYLDDHRRGHRLGLYAQDEIALREDLLLDAGLRIDHTPITGAVFSPRLALIWQAAPATTLKALYGNAYRAPNAYELYYAFPGEAAQLPNPALRRERIASTELALVQQLPASARLTLSAFRTNVSDLISQRDVPGQNALMFVNLDRIGADGVELEYERSWSGGATLRTSVSAVRVRLDDDDPLPVSAPSRLAKFNLSMPLGASPWRAGLEAQYVGLRHGVRGDSPAFWLANLNLASVRLSRHAELALSIANLFGRAYADPGSTEHRQRAIAQDGRSARLQLQLAF